MQQDNPYRAPATTDQSAPAPSDDYYRPPRLTVAYLLAWIVLSVVLIAISPNTASFSQQFVWANFILTMIMDLSAALLAAGILGTFVIVRNKLRGIARRLQPGHWLLIILSMTWLARTMIMLGRRLVFGPPHGAAITGPIDLTGAMLGHLPDAAVALATLCAFVWMAVKLRASWSWRVLAVAMVIMTATVELHYLALAWSMSVYPRPGNHWPQLVFSAYSLESVLVLLLLLAVVLTDFTRREYRDGLHWLGVVFVGWMCVNTFTPQIIALVVSWS